MKKQIIIDLNEYEELVQKSKLLSDVEKSNKKLQAELDEVIDQCQHKVYVKKDYYTTDVVMSQLDSRFIAYELARLYCQVFSPPVANIDNDTISARAKQILRYKSDLKSLGELFFDTGFKREHVKMTTEFKGFDEIENEIPEIIKERDKHNDYDKLLEYDKLLAILKERNFEIFELKNYFKDFFQYKKDIPSIREHIEKIYSSIHNVKFYNMSKTKDKIDTEYWKINSILNKAEKKDI